MHLFAFSFYLVSTCQNWQNGLWDVKLPHQQKILKE